MLPRRRNRATPRRGAGMSQSPVRPRRCALRVHPGVYPSSVSLTWQTGARSAPTMIRSAPTMIEPAAIGGTAALAGDEDGPTCGARAAERFNISAATLQASDHQTACSLDSQSDQPRHAWGNALDHLIGHRSTRGHSAEYWRHGGLKRSTNQIVQLDLHF